MDPCGLPIASSRGCPVVLSKTKESQWRRIASSRHDVYPCRSSWTRCCSPLSILFSSFLRSEASRCLLPPSQHHLVEFIGFFICYSPAETIPIRATDSNFLGNVAIAQTPMISTLAPTVQMYLLVPASVLMISEPVRVWSPIKNVLLSNRAAAVNS